MFSMSVTCSSVRRPTLAEWKIQCVSKAPPASFSLIQPLPPSFLWAMDRRPRVSPIYDCVVMSRLTVFVQRQGRKLPRHLPSSLQRSPSRPPVWQREVPWGPCFFRKGRWNSLDVHRCCIRWKRVVSCSQYIIWSVARTSNLLPRVACARCHQPG